MGVRRIIAAGVIAAVTGALLTVTAGSAAALNSNESGFVKRINAERRERGKGSLSVRSDLVQVARQHSAKMAAKGTIWHNQKLGNQVSGWIVIGENVGMGPSVDSLHGAFMNSQGHKENILYTNYNQIGVGSVVDDDGIIFTTHVFAKRGSSSKPKTVSSSSSSGSKATSTPSTTTSAPKPQPKAKPKPPPEPEPRTVELLVRMVGFDADDVDPLTGTAAGF